MSVGLEDPQESHQVKIITKRYTDEIMMWAKMFINITYEYKIFESTLIFNSRRLLRKIIVDPWCETNVFMIGYGWEFFHHLIDLS